MFAAFIDRLVRSAGPFRSCKRFVRSEDGATAVEFAIVSAPFFALLIALFQSALVFFAGRVLDETVSEASRVIMTGQAQTQGMTKNQFATWVCSNTIALFNCNNFIINVQNYSTFSAANTTTPTLTFDAKGNVTNTWNYSLGNPGDIVVVQVMYQWPVVLGPLSFTLANLSNGNRLLLSSAAFKNEPY
jgi:Flp pilus assembly protein TadG